MNRHQRRALAAREPSSLTSIEDGGALRTKYTGPVRRLRIWLLDPSTRQIRNTLMDMSPDEVRKVLGKERVQWAKLGEIDRVDVMLAGDSTEQAYGRGHRWWEPELWVLDAAGNLGPTLHGKAMVFGFAPELQTACSVPVNEPWISPKVFWNVDEAKAAQAAALEAQRGQIGQAAQPGQDDLPALPSDRQPDG